MTDQTGPDRTQPARHTAPHAATTPVSGKPRRKRKLLFVIGGVIVLLLAIAFLRPHSSTHHAGRGTHKTGRPPRAKAMRAPLRSPW